MQKSFNIYFCNAYRISQVWKFGEIYLINDWNAGIKY
jgi:hypothetical protein